VEIQVQTFRPVQSRPPALPRRRLYYRPSAPPKFRLLRSTRSFYIKKQFPSTPLSGYISRNIHRPDVPMTPYTISRRGGPDSGPIWTQNQSSSCISKNVCTSMAPAPFNLPCNVSVLTPLTSPRSSRAYSQLRYHRRGQQIKEHLTWDPCLRVLGDVDAKTPHQSHRCDSQFTISRDR